MKYYTVIYNNKLVGTFSQYQVLNGFEGYEWRYKYRMKYEMIMPCYSMKIKR